MGNCFSESTTVETFRDTSNWNSGTPDSTQNNHVSVKYQHKHNINGKQSDRLSPSLTTNGVNESRIYDVHTVYNNSVNHIISNNISYIDVRASPIDNQIHAVKPVISIELQAMQQHNDTTSHMDGYYNQLISAEQHQIVDSDNATNTVIDTNTSDAIPSDSVLLLPGAIASINTTVNYNDSGRSMPPFELPQHKLHKNSSMTHESVPNKSTHSTVSTSRSAHNNANNDLMDSHPTEFMTPAKSRKKSRMPSLAITVPRLALSNELISPAKVSTMRYSRRVSVMSGYSSDNNHTYRDNQLIETDRSNINPVMSAVLLTARDTSHAEHNDTINPLQSIQLMCQSIGQQYVTSNMYNISKKRSCNQVMNDNDSTNVSSVMKDCMDQLHGDYTVFHLCTILQQLYGMLQPSTSAISPKQSSDPCSISHSIQQYLLQQYRSIQIVQRKYMLLCTLVTSLLSINDLTITTELFHSELINRLIYMHYTSLLVSIQYNNQADQCRQHVNVLIALLNYAHKLHSQPPPHNNVSDVTNQSNQTHAQSIISSFEQQHIFEYMLQLIQQYQPHNDHVDIQPELYNGTTAEIDRIDTATAAEHSTSDLSMNGWSDSESFDDSYIPNDHTLKLSLALPLMNNTTATNQQQSSQSTHNQTSILQIDQALHTSVLHLILLSLLSLPSTNGYSTLHSTYCDNKYNSLQLLHNHLNSMEYIQPLVDCTAHNSGIQRLLRLMCSSLHNSSLYTMNKQIGRGRYGTVYTGHTADGATVALKHIDMQLNDTTILCNIFNEISILQCLTNDANVSTMIDYGCTNTMYCVVLSYSQCSMKQLLNKIYGGRTSYSAELLQFISGLYQQIMHTVQRFTELQITHYDIKADNILLDCNIDINTSSINDIIQSQCTIRICDYGESIQGHSSKLSRGTENIQSPEMLQLMRHNDSHHSTHDRRRLYTSDSGSDVWSCGCLLYELLTNQYLYNDMNELPIYAQVTDINQPILNSNAIQHLRPWNSSSIISFIQSILIRDVYRRPNINEVIRLYDKMFNIQCTAIESSVTG